jgi:hypothetical protein
MQTSVDTATRQQWIVWAAANRTLAAQTNNRHARQEQPAVVQIDLTVDLDAVRTFVAVVDTGQFQAASGC